MRLRTGHGRSCCGSDAPAEHGATHLRLGASTTTPSATRRPEPPVSASLGCGIPTAVADLHEGETVLDLGSGGGIDVLICARRVGPTGKAIGLDMTDEMLELARANPRRPASTNVEFLKGYIEAIPLARRLRRRGHLQLRDQPLRRQAGQVLREAARVLRPGGRFAVSDVIADHDMDEATRADMAQWTGCIAGALTRDEFEQTLTAAGLHRRRDQRDPPRPRARRLGDRARPQARERVARPARVVGGSSPSPHAPRARRAQRRS